MPSRPHAGTAPGEAAPHRPLGKGLVGRLCPGPAVLRITLHQSSKLLLISSIVAISVAFLSETALYYDWFLGFVCSYFEETRWPPTQNLIWMSRQLMRPHSHQESM